MKKLKYSALNKYVVFMIPFFLSVVIAFIFYPGAMSYDTLHALRSARNGVTDSMWPPMVSYVWRFVDIFSQNPSAMHFSQILILFASLYYIIFYFIQKIKLTTKILIAIIMVPVILGTLGVIWKDVLMSAFLFSGLAVLFSLKNKMNKNLLFYFTFIFFIFLGICSRHNAITAAVPILFYFSYLLCVRIFKNKISLFLSSALMGLILTIGLFAGKSILDNYSLPTFTKMTNPSEYFIRVTKVLDVAGASVCTGENLFNEINPALSIDEIRSGYDPKHVNLSAAVLNKVAIDSRIDHIWLNTFIHHPICAWYNKFHMTRFMLGLNSGAQFLISKEEIDDNEFGYKFEKSFIRDFTYKYITIFSKVPFLRPIFILLMALISFGYMFKTKTLNAESVTIFMSGLFYLGSLVLFGNAADARLPFYSTLCFLLIITLGAFEHYKARSN